MVGAVATAKYAKQIRSIHNVRRAVFNGLSSCIRRRTPSTMNEILSIYNTQWRARIPSRFHQHFSHSLFILLFCSISCFSCTLRGAGARILAFVTVLHDNRTSSNARMVLYTAKQSRRNIRYTALDYRLMLLFFFRRLDSPRTWRRSDISIVVLCGLPTRAKLRRGTPKKYCVETRKMYGEHNQIWWRERCGIEAICFSIHHYRRKNLLFVRMKKSKMHTNCCCHWDFVVRLRLCISFWIGDDWHTVAAYVCNHIRQPFAFIHLWYS